MAVSKRPCGAPWSWASPTPARRVRSTSSPCGAIRPGRVPPLSRIAGPPPRQPPSADVPARPGLTLAPPLSEEPISPHSPNRPGRELPDYTTLVVERKGLVGWLIFDRPDQLNAMDFTMRDELAVAWLELENDPEVRVIVHTGNGRAFQTGVDVRQIATDGVGMQRYRQSMEDWDVHFTSWHQGVTKPVITAVNGICAGGAFHWVADADIVIAAADAQFFDPHVSIGQVVSLEAIDPQDAGRGSHADGAGGPPRADVRRPGLRAGHGQRGRRPARSLQESPRSWRRRWPPTRRPPWPRPRRRCGGHWRWG